jgi:hypothetical protein
MFKEFTLSEIASSRKINTEVFEIIRLLKSAGLTITLESGPWVAGGSLTKAMLNEPISDSDIDIFFPTVRSLSNAINILDLVKGFQRMQETSFSITYKHIPTNSPPIQLVKNKKSFDNKYRLLGHFDFSIVKIITDGESIVCHKDFFKHLDDRKLVLDPFMINDSSLSDRVIKYIIRGFSMDSQTALQIIKHNQIAAEESLYR